MKTKMARGRIAVAASGLSATLLVGGAGALIAQGHDGLAVVLGFAGAAFLASVVIAPLLTAMNCDGISDALRDRRVGSSVVGLAQCVIAICTVGLIAAEITAGGWLMARLSGMPNVQASLVLAGLMGLVVVGCTLNTRGMTQTAWIDGLTAAVIVTAVFGLFVMIERPGAGLGSSLHLAPALGDIARLETQLIEKRIADPALLKPYAVPFLRTSVGNFMALIACLAGGLALLWPIQTHAKQRWPGIGARMGILATLMPLLMLTPYAAETKRAMLMAFDAGMRPGALLAWLQTYQGIGAMQICGSSSMDAGIVAKACGRGVGAQGYVRWHDAVFAPDALAVIGFDALNAPSLLLWLFAVGALLAALIFTVNSTSAATRSFGLAAGPSTWLAKVALVAAGGFVAWLQPADSVTLVAWTASVALAGLGPVCLASCVFGLVHGRAASLAMTVGVTLTLILILGPRYVPLMIADLTGALINAPPAIVRRIATLRDSITTAATPEAQAAALTMAERLARENISWLGLKPLVSGAWGFLFGLIALVVGQSFASLVRRFAPSK